LTAHDYYKEDSKPLPELKLLVPEGYRDILSLDTTTQARITYDDGRN